MSEKETEKDEPGIGGTLGNGEGHNPLVEPSTRPGAEASTTRKSSETKSNLKAALVTRSLVSREATAFSRGTDAPGFDLPASVTRQGDESAVNLTTDTGNILEAKASIAASARSCTTAENAAAASSRDERESMLSNTDWPIDDNFEAYDTHTSSELWSEDVPSSFVIQSTGKRRSVVTAELVEESMGEAERQRIMDDAMQTIKSEAAAAEVVNVDRNRRALFLCVGAFALVIAGVVTGAVLGRSPPPPPPPDTGPRLSPTKAPTLAPTLTPTTYEQGGSAFFNNEQLYHAVDAYAVDAFFNAATRTESLKTSAVAKRYGYPIGSWNVSLITNFSRVFDLERINPVGNSGGVVGRHLKYGQRNDQYASTFNEDLSGWDMSNAVTMFRMFSSATQFIGMGLSAWDVSKVKNFSYAFSSASIFNGNISAWNTSSAVTMEAMFLDAVDFRGDGLGEWDVSSVKTMKEMFNGATNFIGNVSKWNTSSVVDMSYLVSPDGQ